MRRITVEVPDTCESCNMCRRCLQDPVHSVCSVFNERVPNFKPCRQCIAAGQTKYLLVYMDGGIPQHVAIVSSLVEAEEVIKNYNRGFLPEDAGVAEQMGDTWGRVDIDGEAEVYIVPFGQVE